MLFSNELSYTCLCCWHLSQISFTSIEVFPHKWSCPQTKALTQKALVPAYSFTLPQILLGLFGAFTRSLPKAVESCVACRWWAKKQLSKLLNAVLQQEGITYLHTSEHQSVSRHLNVFPVLVQGCIHQKLIAEKKLNLDLSELRHLFGYLDCIGLHTALGSGVVKPNSCQKKTLLWSSEDKQCVRSKEVLRQTLDTNCEWGDKLGIMDIENSGLMVIGRNHTGLASRYEQMGLQM